MKKLCVILLCLLLPSFSFAIESQEYPKPIKAAVGDEFIIALESNHTTGYQWQIASPLDGNLLKVEKTDYVPSTSGLVGGGGKEEWTFKALGGGKAILSLKYVKPWEKGVQPAREKTFQIVITDKSQFTGFDYLKLAKKQRVTLIQSSIESARRDGVIIKNKPTFYCSKLDTFYEKNPNNKKEALNKLLKTLIIMEYDWEQKGVDKDKLAREWLGEDLYQANKVRLEKR